MQRILQFDDATHECLFIRKGVPLAVETMGDPTFNVRTIFILRTDEDVTRAEKILAVCRDMIAVWKEDGPVCGKCGIGLNSETAEGREDGLYCDKCITEIADKTPIQHP